MSTTSSERSEQPPQSAAHRAAPRYTFASISIHGVPEVLIAVMDRHDEVIAVYNQDRWSSAVLRSTPEGEHS